MKNFPYKVTDFIPQVLFRITANNANSSHSVCQVAIFDGNNILLCASICMQCIEPQNEDSFVPNMN